MHQYNIGAPFKRIAISVTGNFAGSDQNNRYLLIIMNYFTKWLEAYTIPNLEALTVAEALVTNFFCHFRVLRVLHRYYNFESQLIRMFCNAWE
jgi:hypothetical protein